MSAKKKVRTLTEEQYNEYLMSLKDERPTMLIDKNGKRVPQDDAGQNFLYRGAPTFHHSGRGPHPCHEGRERHRTGYAREPDEEKGILLRPLQFPVCEIRKQTDKRRSVFYFVGELYY